MPTRVAINGFGRIGRQAFKIALGHPELEVVAINDIGDVDNMAYLLKHDTVYRADKQDVRAEGSSIVVDGKSFPVLSVRVPNELPWKENRVDVVIESTGRFTKRKDAEAHLEAGARAVVISAPASGAPAFVLGVNDNKYNPAEIPSSATPHAPPIRSRRPWPCWTRNSVCRRPS